MHNLSELLSILHSNRDGIGGGSGIVGAGIHLLGQFVKRSRRLLQARCLLLGALGKISRTFEISLVPAAM